MSKQGLISRYNIDFTWVMSFLVTLFLLIGIGPGASPGLAAQVTLSWNASTASSGYKLYYGTASRTYNSPVDVGSKTQYTLTNIVEGKTAYFAVTSYDSNRVESGFSQELKCVSLTPSAGANGTISPSNAVIVSSDMSQTFTIIPAANYKVSDVKIDGVSVGAKTSYTFSNVTASHNIYASFSATTAPLKLDFEEGSGSTAIDSSGSGNNGTISNAVYTTDRATGSHALSFAGKGRVSVLANPSIKPSNISVGFWVKHTTDTSSSYGGIIQGAYGDGYSKGFRVLDYQNKPLVQINFGDAGPIKISGKAFALNQWTHIVFSYDHQKVKLYQDGVLFGEISETRNINWNTTASNLTIGLAQWYFRGLIDNVQLFDHALSSKEIAQLYADSNVTASFIAAEKLELNFEQGSGSTAIDSSGSGNNGTISKAVYTTDAATGSYALSFDGKSSVVSVLANSSLKPSNISVGFWVKHTADTSSSYGGIIQGAYGDGYSKGFRILDYQNKPLVQINFGDAGPIKISGKAFVQNQWTHVAFSYDHQKVKLYQNGVLAGELSETRNINWNTTASNLTIGMAQWYFKGLIDRVQLFDRSLSPQEIEQLYVETGFASYSSVNSSSMRSDQTSDKQISSARTTHSPTAPVKKGSETQKARKQKITQVESRLLAGSGMLPGSGGWIKVLTPDGEEAAPSVHIDLPEYNALSGEIQIATGDIDGDGRDNIVVGLGRIQNEPGIWGGYFAVLDDNYAIMAIGQIEWPEYNATNGETRPACGDIDGDGIAEIIIGLGPGGEGRMEIFKFENQQLKHVKWLQTGWEDYNRGNGEIRPACGDLDGDGKDEVVAGLGPVMDNPDIPGGVFFILDTAAGSVDIPDAGQSDISGWGVVSWPEYNRINGETWPACGDINGDGKDEILLGLGKQGEGRFEILGFDLLQNSTRPIAWQQSLLSEGAAIHLACGNLETDDGDQIVIGYSRDGIAILEIFGNAAQDFQAIRQVETHVQSPAKQESEIWPAVFRLRDK